MHLLFDLDGTLTDSRQGIIRCIQHALRGTGCEAPPAEQLTRYVGPPLARSFSILLGTSEPVLIDRAITTYRQRFERLGMFENSVYPGIEEALSTFAKIGHDLYVVTAKPRIYAGEILSHFGIASLFRGVYGPDLGQRHFTKESLMREAMRDCDAEARQAVMIGDRAEDIIGARAIGLRSVAVTWGYGEREELEAAQPDHLVHSASELVACIRGVT